MPKLGPKALIQRPFAGHLIVHADCQFFRTTDVRGKWRVSTVGEYQPGNKLPPDLRQKLGWYPGQNVEVGFHRLYETMVFPLGDRFCPCGCESPLVASWAEDDMEGYLTRKAAELGHARMVRKYLTLTRPTRRSSHA